jgi:nitrite reductase/ring-hydroxylating ferredoxin subunit
MPETFTVAKAYDIPEGRVRVVKAGGREIALVRAGGRFVALSNTCRHRGGPVGEGDVDVGANTVACPWHGWEYDLATGKATLNPAARLDVYPVEVVGDDVRVTL